MNQGNNAEIEPNGLSMLQASLLSRIEEVGTNQGGYAETIGISRSSLSHWLKHDVDPGRVVSTRANLSQDLGISPESLKILGSVNVREACEIVLATKAAEDPAERAVRKKFFGLMIENGGDISPSAYMIFLTGSLESRQQMVAHIESLNTTRS